MLALLTVMTVSGASFELLVTQDPPGPNNQNPANWQGVLRYSVTIASLSEV